MVINMAVSPLLWLLIGPLAAGGIFLQFFLSNRKIKLLGFILPGITFVNSILMVLGIAAFDGTGSGKLVLLMSSVFLTSNLPTIVLLGIYYGCRRKFKFRAQLDKMNIQDLD